MPDTWQERIYSKLVPRERANVFEEIRRCAEDYLPEGGVVLDFGCSSTPFFIHLKPQAGWYIGVDIDASIPGRCSLLDEFICVDLCEVSAVLPLPDASVDLVVSNMVFEHLPRMGNVLRELLRVLKPGGMMLVSVPNLYYPVFTFNKILSFLRLDRFKKFLLRMFCWRSESSIFPAFYRCASVGVLERELLRVAQGGEPIEWTIEGFFGGCGYFRWSRLFFSTFLLYEYLVYRIAGERLMPYLLLMVKKRGDFKQHAANRWGP